MHVCITAQVAFGHCEGYAQMRVGERLFIQVKQTNMAAVPRFANIASPQAIPNAASDALGEMYRLGLSGHGFAPQAAFRMA